MDKHVAYIILWTSLVAQTVKRLSAMQESQVQSLGREDPLEKGMANHASILWASQVAQVVKNPPVNAEDIGDKGSIPGSGRSPGRQHGNPLQHSCLEYPMDRGAWWATVHGVTKSQTQLSN